jgi:hypothetical protein
MIAKFVTSAHKSNYVLHAAAQQWPRGASEAIIG